MEPFKLSKPVNINEFKKYLPVDRHVCRNLLHVYTEQLRDFDRRNVNSDQRNSLLDTLNHIRYRWHILGQSYDIESLLFVRYYESKIPELAVKLCKGKVVYISDIVEKSIPVTCKYVDEVVIDPITQRLTIKQVPIVDSTNTVDDHLCDDALHFVDDHFDCTSTDDGVTELSCWTVPNIVVYSKVCDIVIPLDDVPPVCGFISQPSVNHDVSEVTIEEPTTSQCLAIASVSPKDVDVTRASKKRYPVLDRYEDRRSLLTNGHWLIDPSICQYATVATVHDCASYPQLQIYRFLNRLFPEERQDWINNYQDLHLCVDYG